MKFVCPFLYFALALTCTMRPGHSYGHSYVLPTLSSSVRRADHIFTCRINSARVIINEDARANLLRQFQVTRIPDDRRASINQFIRHAASRLQLNVSIIEEFKGNFREKTFVLHQVPRHLPGISNHNKPIPTPYEEQKLLVFAKRQGQTIVANSRTPFLNQTELVWVPHEFTFIKGHKIADLGRQIRLLSEQPLLPENPNLTHEVYRPLLTSDHKLVQFHALDHMLEKMDDWLKRLKAKEAMQQKAKLTSWLMKVDTSAIDAVHYHISDLLVKMKAREAIPLLMRQLKRSNFISTSDYESLKSVTGLDLGTNPKAWLKWWSRQNR